MTDQFETWPEAAAESAVEDGRASAVRDYDWSAIGTELDDVGAAVLPALIDRGDCDTLVAGYGPGDTFRSHVVMARHGFGRGEYRYYAYPLPPLVARLRSELYRRLVPIANRWHERLSSASRFPADHASFLARCHAAGQQRPTPLQLRYGSGDYNCLHQDLYGEHVFPLQVAVLLSDPDIDFAGGGFVLTEQRPRMQSRVEVVPLAKGDGVVFAVAARPRAGTRGDHRVTMRHGVSRVRSGRRHTLGIIFHDAA